MKNLIGLLEHIVSSPQSNPNDIFITGLKYNYDSDGNRLMDNYVGERIVVSGFYAPESVWLDTDKNNLWRHFTRPKGIFTQLLHLPFPISISQIDEDDKIIGKNVYKPHSDQIKWLLSRYNRIPRFSECTMISSISASNVFQALYGGQSAFFEES